MKNLIFMVLISLSILSCNLIENKKETTYQEKSNIYEINWVVPKTSYPEINKEIRRSLKESQADIIKTAKEFHEELLKNNETSSLLPYELKGSYEVIENDLDIYSLIYKTYFYTGGAHGIEGYTVYNISKDTNKPVKLEELIGKDYKKKIIGKINKVIDENNLLKDENPKKISYFVDKITNLEGTSFYFQGKNLVILFPEYVITPYSSGKITFKFPLYKILD
ncbi:DUF3298 and DUF4163 domain-containing protein [Psychrilyobacter atlanticus]|uniref:DUF3298 and DUF4163 domain-containing protein n=1 Tax=Psychrilyobacter atlanticus TaxID=271091 RepID=UPI0003F605BA|nr:DUF4163 domain-containing protein [Psychrilyobacter atlanticus]